MKSIVRRTLALVACAAVMQWNQTASAQVYDMADDESFQGGVEQHAVLTIKSDGSCWFATETLQSRTLAEQQERMLERYRKMAEGEGETTPEAEQSSTNETAATKPFTDEELTKKITETKNLRTDESGDDSAQQFHVEVKKDIVVTTATRSFASLEEMLKASYAIWNQGGVAFENVRFETDTNGLLRVTLTPQRGMERYVKTVRSQWKLSGTKTELKVVFPGRVISSGFPAMQTNATWLAVDAKQDETLDAVAKLYATPTVITAEPGGLKLDRPLESEKLQRFGRQPGAASEDLPISDAGPGFVAEAQSITTTTLHVFSGGEDYFKQNDHAFGVQTGAIVSVKLFAPKGRTLQSVGDSRVIAAVDDKGRSVVAEAEDTENVSSEAYSSGSQDANSLPIQLRLQLPQPDAQALDEISAEAVATTVGSWKNMTLTNLEENATNELDLSAVLPGAKLTITKFSSKNSQFNIQVRLQGPRTVRGMNLRASIPGNDRFNGNSSERNFSTKDGVSTRTLTIQGYSFGNEDPSLQASVVLTVRYPEDLRRERIKFKLKGLDLL